MNASWIASPSHPKRLAAVIAEGCGWIKSRRIKDGPLSNIERQSIEDLSNEGGPLSPLEMAGIKTTPLRVIIEESGYDRITLAFDWQGQPRRAVLKPSFNGFDYIIDGDNHSDCALAMSATIYSALNQMVEIYPKSNP